ncbi:MAG TPA: MarR family transcriptional regulator [Bacteroidota bacterium]|nr:MarR family transcriptional regulator [Bacteroidota bacterium]
MKTTRKYGKKADLALSLWVKLARASSIFGRLTASDIQTYGLTPPQFSVIETLGHLGPMKMGSFCSKLLTSGGNITVVIDNLEKDGLVERVPVPEDRRAITVQLTAKGEKMFNEIFAKHAQFVTKMASVLDENEQMELSALLKKLGMALQEKF